VLRETSRQLCHCLWTWRNKKQHENNFTKPINQGQHVLTMKHGCCKYYLYFKSFQLYHIFLILNENILADIQVIKAIYIQVFI